MAQQPAQAVENNFTGGLKTEFTGLNFPQHAATDTNNCTYTLVGDVTRRMGFDFEENYSTTSVDRIGQAMSTYRWTNVGGDGNSQIVVVQVGNILRFYLSSASTVADPLSDQLLVSTINLNNFAVRGVTTGIPAQECQYTDGNGYLIVTHPLCEVVYLTYDPGTKTVTWNPIFIQIRDFVGVIDNAGTSSRPSALTQEHLYNLQNQGWTSGTNWTTFSTTSATVSTGVHVWTVQAGLPILAGDAVNVAYAPAGSSLVVNVMAGNVTVYTGTTLQINVSLTNSAYAGNTYHDWIFYPTSHGYIDTWHTQLGNYPSNADVWWNYKDSTDQYNPSGTYTNTTLNSGLAPRGHYVINAFAIDRSLFANVPGLTVVETLKRPTVCSWFQGRVWYAGLDDSKIATGNANYYTWTENIYFSQTVTSPDQFAYCYQNNDPTSETLFDLLPTDGGIIQIQGCGSIYKLFPIQNGMLVFAANGIWFITGSQGIGFAANDYTVTKISNIQSISNSSFVNVQGLPYFWNEEGVYSVQPADKGGLTVESMTVSTIESFYDTIPFASKKLARGDYNPIEYTIQWVYKSNESNDVLNSYNYDRILVFNTYNKAFYPYSFDSPVKIHGINYIPGRGGNTAPEPTFKYLTSKANGPTTYDITFSDERDEDYLDWQSAGTGSDYESFFVTGYNLTGKALLDFQSTYVYMFSRQDTATAYKIQGIWDFANSGASGRYSNTQRYSSEQHTTNGLSRFGMVYRKHKIRGHGLALQLRVSSITGMPFDIIGWSSWSTVNAGV